MIDGQEVEIQSNPSSQFVMMKKLPKNRTESILNIKIFWNNWMD